MSKCFHERVIKQMLSASILPPQQGGVIALTEGGKMVINSPDEEVSGLQDGSSLCSMMELFGQILILCVQGTGVEWA